MNNGSGWKEEGNEGGERWKRKLKAWADGSAKTSNIPDVGIEGDGGQNGKEMKLIN